MDVTKATFAYELPEIKRAVDEATFISIDCEITGLSSCVNIEHYESLVEYYKQFYTHIKDFLVIQYGVSTFRYVGETHSFKVKTYNFYVFPRKCSNLQDDQSFLCQASSIEFLIEKGFDFNKLFMDGIPYLNLRERRKFLLTLENQQKVKDEKHYNNLYIPERHQPIVDSAFAIMENFLESNERERVLPNYNAFIRRLIYQSLASRLDKRAALKTCKLPDHTIRLVVSRPKTAAEINAANRALLRKATGFAELIQFIVQSRKPVVGHNMLLDVSHTINRFLIDLPDEYQEFKNCVNCQFPCLLDTKHIGSGFEFSSLIPSTVLGEMVTTLCKPPFMLPRVELENAQSSLDTRREHEAGYDSYITGLCLLGLWSHIGRRAGYGRRDVYEHFELLQPYMNKIHMMRQEVPFMRTDGPDPPPASDYVFHMTFPSTWLTNDIHELFSPYSSVRVTRLNNTSATVTLYNRSHAADILRTLSESSSTRYTLTTQAQHAASLQHAVPRSPGPSPGPVVATQQIPDDAQPQEANGKFTLVRNRRKRAVPNGEEPETSMKRLKGHSMGHGILAKKKKPVRRVQKNFAEDDSWD